MRNMALPSAYWILFFYLLLLMCDHGSGARDIVAKKEYRKQAVKATDPKESDYKTAYGTRQGYVAAYSTKHNVKDSGYAATYGTEHDVDESGYAAGYEAAYQTKQDAKDSYNTAYGTKEDSKEHADQQSEGKNHKEMNQPYIAQYGTKKAFKDYGMEYKEHPDQQVEVAIQKEIDQPYIAGYTKRQPNYITNYGTREDVEDNYIAQYGTKKALKDTEMKNKEHGHHQVEVENQKEMNQPYIAGYTKRQPNYITSYGTREDVEDNYIIQYGTKKALKDTEMKNKEHGHHQVEVGNQKEMNQPYIAGYTKRQPNYITGYGTREDVEDNYIAQYGTKKALEDTEMKNKEHPDQQVEVAIQKEIDQPYIAGYTKRQANYITSYGTREDVEDNYIAQYGTKKALKDTEMKNKEHGHHQVEVENQKEMNQPYIAGYTKRQPNYITSYGTREDVKDNYMAQYGTKEALKDPEMENKEHCGQQVGVANQKEMNQAYIAGYRNREANHITGYGGRGDAKDSYITAYTKKSQNPYIAGYRNTQDVHENQMATKPSSSSHMDHSEAFKSGFFTIDDLYVGRTMAVHFPIQELPPFLPREEADSIPFSMPQLPNVLQLFSIPADSPNAKAMKDTLQQCESLPIKGEIKLCATSLESMLDFVNNIIGSWTNLNVLTTTHPTMPTALTQNYSVLRISEEIYAPKWVACHPLPYPYKVFYCHFIENSKIFKVSLGGENGQKVEAVAVCHMDTSDWDPDHILFRQLGIKPSSSSPICHFLPVYHLVWVPLPTTASI